MEVLSFVHAYEAPVIFPDKVRAGIVTSLQTVTGAGWSAIGVGLTVMVKVRMVPEQLLATGVIAIVAVTGVVPVFMAVKVGIFPLPLACRPIPGWELVQVKAVSLTGPVTGISAMTSVLHTTWLSIALTVGRGCMVRVTRFREGLSHPVASVLAAA